MNASTSGSADARRRARLLRVRAGRARGRGRPSMLYMDAFGIRADLDVMAARLADAGYVVAVPNLYHRSGAFPPFDPALVAAGGAERDRFMGMIRSIDGDMVMRDTAAVLAHLDTRPTVRPGPIGTVGYCMGGGYALRAAGVFPDRVAAAASFHGGSLATDRPDSPHQLAPVMRARLYVGVAGIDPGFTDEQRQRLDAALRAARRAITKLRSTRAPSTALRSTTTGSTTAPRRSATGSGCWRCSRPSCGPAGRPGISLAPRSAARRRTMRAARIGGLVVVCGAADGGSGDGRARAARTRTGGAGVHDARVRRAGRLGADQEPGARARQRDARRQVRASSRRRRSRRSPSARCTSRRSTSSCSATLGGKTPAPTLANPKATTKAEVVAALQASFDYGAAVHQGVQRPAARRAHRVDAVPRPDARRG